jgi:hypothetical protein
MVVHTREPEHLGRLRQHGPPERFLGFGRRERALAYPFEEGGDGRGRGSWWKILV